MRYALVIPALNEEEAIAGTLRRSLAARPKVLSQTAVTQMTVVFVNDGSTDQTHEIVNRAEFDEIIKVEFNQNQGYGAAIQAGWRATDADLVGFMDADGTCDPDYSVQLINCLTRTQADVVLAARLNPGSHMPGIRKLGNILFARLLGAVSRKKLTDCASGFRVVRRSSLHWISPLPKGMHFTPAMSAICLLDPRLRIEEVPMPYHERIGRSKLSVIKDGMRFLYVILFTICCYSPIRTMLLVSGMWTALVAIIAAILARAGASEATQFLTLSGGLVATHLVWTGVVCHQLNFLLIGPRQDWGRAERLLQRLLEYKLLILSGLALLVVGLVGIVLSELTNATTRSTLLTLAFLVVSGATTSLVGVIVRVIWAVGEKQKALLGEDLLSWPSPSLVSPPTPSPILEPTMSSVPEPVQLSGLSVS
jgi:glycosyltransferase involved in cell wall biosynthesis